MKKSMTKSNNKFNMDEFDFSTYKRPWGNNLELAPVISVTTRNCCRCNKPLPPNRYFNHDECLGEGGDDELFVAHMHELHLPPIGARTGSRK